MKIQTKILATVLGLGASALLIAQDAPNSSDGARRHPPRHRPPPPAVIIALDANHDGVIDAAEIANASAALAALDKNGDGQLTPDEFVGPRPEGPGGPPRPEGEEGPGPGHRPPGQ